MEKLEIGLMTQANEALWSTAVETSPSVLQTLSSRALSKNVNRALFEDIVDFLGKGQKSNPLNFPK